MEDSGDDSHVVKELIVNESPAVEEWKKEQLFGQLLFVRNLRPVHLTGKPLLALDLGQRVVHMKVALIARDDFVQLVRSTFILAQEVAAEGEVQLSLVGIQDMQDKFGSVLGQQQVLVEDAVDTPM